MRHKGPRLCLQEDAGNRSSGYAMDPQGTISNVAYGNTFTMYSATSRLARRSLPTTLGNLPGKLGNVPKPKNLGNVPKKSIENQMFLHFQEKLVTYQKSLVIYQKIKRPKNEKRQL